MIDVQRELAWPRSVVSAAATLALVVMALGGVYFGIAVRRFGAALLLSVGLTLMGVGLICTAYIRESLPFIFTFGVVAGAGFGLLAPAALATAVAMFFNERRGLATGIAISGCTVGPMLALPLAAEGIASEGWRWTFLVFGLTCLILVPAVALGLRAAGLPTSEAVAKSPSGDSLLAAFGSKTFHLVFWGFLICGFTTLGAVETHFLPYAELCGFSSATAAKSYSVLSIFNLAGVILAGWLADRFSPAKLLAGIYFVRALSFLLLNHIDGEPIFLLLFSATFGLIDYATTPIVASLVATRLGVHMMGPAMGVMAMGHQFGSALGALGGGVIYDAFKSYFELWNLAFLLAIVAALMSLAIPARTSPAPHGQAS